MFWGMYIEGCVLLRGIAAEKKLMTSPSAFQGSIEFSYFQCKEEQLVLFGTRRALTNFHVALLTCSWHGRKKIFGEHETCTEV